MINDDATDKKYALACLKILDAAKQLDPVLINQRFIEAGNTFYPDFDGPKNLMLQEVCTGVMFDDLNPEWELSDPDIATARYRVILSDYLAGNYYPSYYSLSGTYGNAEQGYSWSVSIRKQSLKVCCGNPDISVALRTLASGLEISGDDYADLILLQRNLPESVEGLLLSSSDLRELLR